MKLLGMMLLHVFSTAKAAPASGYDRVTTIPIECGRQFLLSIEDDTEGVNLSAIVASPNKLNQVTLLHLAGQHPPSDVECGEDHFRCKNHVVVKNNVINSSILFVALQNSLLLANFVSNDTNLTLQDYHLINLTHFNCSPITSLEIARSAYTICLNLEQSYLSLFETRLNTESLSRTTIVGPLARNYFELSASVGLSEFKYVELYRFHFIYFVYANHLYYFEPLEYTLDYVGDLHQNCSSVRELEYAGDDTLIAHCRNRAAVYFNLAYGYRTYYQTYADSGRPYVCTNLNTRLTIFQQNRHIQISEGNTNNIQLMGEDFVSGECFGDNRGFYFAYIDQTIGSFVLDLTTFNFTQLSNQSCSITNQECTPLEVLNNQYIVVHELANDQDGTALIKIFDSQYNFQMVAELTLSSVSTHFNRSLNIVTILSKTVDSCYTATVATTDLDNIRSTTTVAAASTSYITTERTELYHDDISKFNTLPPSDAYNTELGTGLIAAGLVAIVILIVLIVIIIIVIVQCHVFMTKWQTTYSRSQTFTDTAQRIVLMAASKPPEAVTVSNKSPEGVTVSSTTSSKPMQHECAGQPEQHGSKQKKQAALI